MYDKAEHRVAMARLVAERRAAGLSEWAETVNLRGLADRPLIERRDAIVRRLRASLWLRESDDWSDIAMAVDELAEVDTEKDFGAVMDTIYYEADYARVWLATA